MRHVRAFFLPALVSVVLSGCRKDPPLPVPFVKVTVEPRWNGAPFDRSQVRPNGAGQRILVQQLKLYLSDLALVGEGDTLKLFEAELFGIVNGPVSRTYLTREGHFSEVRFGLGLPPRLNHRDISQVPVNDPLGNNSGMYWTWATMYRFVVFDGRFDTEVTGTGPLPYQFSIHTGLDTLFRPIARSLDVDVRAGDTAHVTVVVDIGRFFNNGSQVLDLSQGSQWHGTVEDLPLGIRVADLQRDAITVE
jgi:hypothetical protein